MPSSSARSKSSRAAPNVSEASPISASAALLALSSSLRHAQNMLAPPTLQSSFITDVLPPQPSPHRANSDTDVDLDDNEQGRRRNNAQIHFAVSHISPGGSLAAIQQNSSILAAAAALKKVSSQALVPSNGNALDHSKFVLQVWKMLNENLFASVVSWDSEGTSFSIFDESSFVRSVCPALFNISDLQHFASELVNCGFEKSVTVQGHLAFKHEAFIRNRPDLLTEISQKSAEVKTQYSRSRNDLQGIQEDVDSVKGYHDRLSNDLNKLTDMLKILAQIASKHILRPEHGDLKSRMLNVEAGFAASPGVITGSQGSLPLASLQKMRSERGKRKAEPNEVDDGPATRTRRARKESEATAAAEYQDANPFAQSHSPDITSGSPALNTRARSRSKNTTVDWNPIPLSTPVPLAPLPGSSHSLSTAPFLVPNRIRDSAFIGVPAASSGSVNPILPSSTGIPNSILSSLPTLPKPLSKYFPKVSKVQATHDSFRKPPSEIEQLQTQWNDFPSTFWSDFEMLKKLI